MFKRDDVSDTTMNSTINNLKLTIYDSAFTLIELLVVISIIGVLAAMVTVSFTASQKQARDTARKSDLTQYRNALESFANTNSGFYPAYPSKTDPSGALCTTLNVGTCPEDPKNKADSTYFYSYISDGTAGKTNATQYVLWAQLENVSSTTYWVVCSNGTSGTSTSVPNSGTCPI